MVRIEKRVSLEQAKKLIKLARDSISSFFKSKLIEISEDIRKEFSEKRGCFVSIYVGNELNGCIGYPEPVEELWRAVAESARNAAFEDPRFPPLAESQMKDMRVELSILTKPEEIIVNKWEDYPSKVKIGKDGLVIRDEFGSGLLLPQVAVEWGWDSSSFLDNTCKKAGLEPDCWRNMKKNVFKFQAQVFTEEKGKVIEKKL